MAAARRLVFAALAGVAVGGCGAPRKQSVNTGLGALLGPGAHAAPAAPAPPRKVEPPATHPELAALIEQQAVDTQRLLDELEHKPARPTQAVAAAPAPAAPSTPPPVEGPELARSEESSTPAEPVASAGLGALFSGDTVQTGLGDAAAMGPPPPEPAVSDSAAAPAPGRSREERLAEAVAGVVEVLGEASPDLSESQKTTVEALREAARTIALAASNDWGGLEESPDRLSELADRAAATRPLRVREARLCSRVRGFGQYTQLSEGNVNRLVAGRSQRAIVYVEVDRFAHQEIGSGDEALSAAREQGDRWAVELSQEINLYSDAGNLLVLRHPAERVLETSRAKRRDFYLVREINLPPTLGAGRYNLKVTLRDKTSGAQAEAVIPIEVVADSGLTKARP